MIVKAPNDVVEYIREKFTLSMGKVIKHDGTVQSFTIINKRNYSMSYIKDVLEGKDPDLSVLFDIKDGKLYRNQDPVWSMYRGTMVSEKGAKICGVLVTNEGIKDIEYTKTEKLKQVTPASLVLEPLVVSEYVKEYIKDRFRIRNREVVYIKGDKPFGAYATIDGMHYSRSYVQQVLEGKNPDISDLFELRDGVICRSQDPIWGSFRGRAINSAKVCGVSISKEGFRIMEEKPREPTPPSLEYPLSDYYKAIDIPEHIKRLIKFKFKIKEGKVFYKNTREETELETYSNLYGHRYSISCILAVLRGEKPNLESLFTISKGCRIRNDDPVWDSYKNTKSTKSFYSTCGENIPVNLVDPPIQRPGDFEWLAGMVKQSDGTFSYKGKSALAHRINNIIYSTGFIRRSLEGEVFTQEKRPPVPAYLYKYVKVPGNSPVIMTSDDEVWKGKSKLVEVLEGKKYMINGFVYTGEEIINKVKKDKSCIWDSDVFLKVAKRIYPDEEVVANIPLSDREETGEI